MRLIGPLWQLRGGGVGVDMGRQRVVHPDDAPTVLAPSTNAPASASHFGTFACTESQTDVSGGNTVAFAIDGLTDERGVESTRSDTLDAPEADATKGQSVPGAETNASCHREIAAPQRAGRPPGTDRIGTGSDGNGRQVGQSGPAQAWGLPSCSERSSEIDAGQEQDDSHEAEPDDSHQEELDDNHQAELDDSHQAELDDRHLRALQVNSPAPRRVSKMRRRSTVASPAHGGLAVVDPKDQGQTGASRRNSEANGKSNLRSSKLGLRSSRRSSTGNLESSQLRSSVEPKTSLRSSVERRDSATRRGSGPGDDALLQTFFSSLLAQRASASRLTVDPDANWLKLWDLVQVFCIFYKLFVGPLADRIPFRHSVHARSPDGMVPSMRD